MIKSTAIIRTTPLSNDDMGRFKYNTFVIHAFGKFHQCLQGLQLQFRNLHLQRQNKKTKKKPAPIHINLTTIHSDNENMDKKQSWGYNG